MKKLGNKILKLKHSIFNRHIILTLILLLAIFLRFYNLQNMCHFETDQANDSFIVKRMIQNGEIPLKGARCGSCTEEIYDLGPIYFYLLSISYIIFNFHPLSGAFFTAVLSFFSVYLCYKVGSMLFNKNVGLISAFLFSFTPFIVDHSHYQININIIPFFVFLCLYSLLKIKQNKQNYWYLFSFSFGILLQLHLTNLFFIPAIFLFFLIFKPKINLNKMLQSFLIIIVLFIPYLIYEFSSSSSNTLNFINYFLKSANLGLNLEMLKNFLISQSYWDKKSILMTSIIFIPSFISSLYLIKKRDKKAKEIKFLIIWISLIIFIQIFNKSLHPSPCNFLVITPATTIVYGFFIFSAFKTRNKFLIFYITILLVFMLIFNTINLYEVLASPEAELGDKMRAVDFIIENSTSDIINIKLVRAGWEGYPYELPYLYIFEYYRKKINLTNESDYVIIDPDYPIAIDYANKIDFRKDFGLISVIKIKNK